MKSHKNDFELIKKRLMKAQENFEIKKGHNEQVEDLGETNKKQQMRRLIENNQLVAKQDFNFQNMKRGTMILENVSIEVLKNLEHNTENMKNTDSKVQFMNIQIDHSNSLMAGIMKKENRNKLLISLLSLIIFVVFIFIIYFKFIKYS